MDELTTREQQVARLMADGCTNAEIAEQLGTGFSTVKWHISVILSKLGAETREEAAERWKQEHSVRGRLRRAPAALFGGLSLKPLGAILGGSALAAGGALVVVAVASGGSDGREISVDAPPVLVLASQDATAAPSPTLEAKPGEYIVREGDTCASITEQLQIPEVMLRARNAEIESLCTSLQPGMVLRAGPPGRVQPDTTGFVRLADLDGDPDGSYLAGVVAPESGLVLGQYDASGAKIGENDVSMFRDWEFFIAAAGTGRGTGGTVAVAGSERIARIDLVVDGGPPTPYTPVAAPAALNYPLNVLYISVPPGDVWEFWAYDADGNYLGTVAHGSGVGAGDAYVERGGAGGPPPPTPGPRPDRIDAESNGHILRIWPEDGAAVAFETIAASPDTPERPGVCADVSEVGRGPDVSLSNVQFLVDTVDVTARLTRYFDGDPETATTGTVCYAPEEGLSPGRHMADITISASADRSAGVLAWVWWQFDVLPAAVPAAE